MSKTKQFFSKIGYSDILDKLEADDADVDQIAEAFQNEYKDVITTEVKKETKGVSKEDEEAIYKKIKSSLFQKIKSGLKLSDVGNVKEYEDEAAFIEAVKDEVTEREKAGDKELKSKFDGLTEKYNDVVTNLEDVSGKLSAKENEFGEYKTKFEKQVKTKSRFDKSLTGIEFGVSDAIVNDYKTMWWNQIRENYQVDPDTGEITDKDGQFIVEDKRKIGTLDEWVKVQIDSRGLGKQNNGRKAGQFSEGTKAADPSLNQDLEKAREEGVSEDVIKAYMANRQEKVS